jgi:hypothetical protein
MNPTQTAYTPVNVDLSNPTTPTVTPITTQTPTTTQQQLTGTPTSSLGALAAQVPIMHRVHLEVKELPLMILRAQILQPQKILKKHQTLNLNHQHNRLSPAQKILPVTQKRTKIKIRTKIRPNPSSTS